MELTGASSARLVWLPPAVPAGVTLLHFQVHYHITATPQEDQGGRLLLGEQVLQSVQSAATVRDLALDRLYRFQVVASYLEVDGEVYEGETAGGGEEQELYVASE